MNSIYNFEKILKNTNTRFIETQLRPFLRTASYTLNSGGILEAKNFLISYISEFCEEIKEYPGEINPLIIARVNGKTKKSLLVYMMYDTQPISKEEEWISNPFGAEIHVLPPPMDVLGDCIITRGAYNSKSPLICFLNVVKELKEKDELPISLLLLFDGEEEQGSPSLLKFIEEQKKVFKDCLDAYYPSIKQNLSGNSVLKLGYKGILSLTLKVSSQNKEPHSAFSAMIPNPTFDLISLLNTIFTNNEFQIKSLRKPYEMTEDEKSILNNLISKFEFTKIKEKAGIIQTRETNPKIAFRDYLFNPTFNISTLKSGFLKEGLKNYVPNEAICKLDIRYAHDVSVDIIFKEIKEKVENFSKKSYSDITLIRNIAYDNSRVKKDSILVKSLMKSAEILGINSEIWPLSGAAAPLSQIQKVLGINFITGGLGIGGFAHSANEFVKYESIIDARLSYLYFLQKYYQLYKEKNYI